MLTQILAFVVAIAVGSDFPAIQPSSDGPRVTVTHLPRGYLQPSAVVGPDGVVHVVCLTGKPEASDVVYLRRTAGAREFEKVIPVNSVPGSAVAVGTIRGAQMSLGKDGRVHVVWNGSRPADEKAGSRASEPLWYTRLDTASGKFEAQRNLIGGTRSLDGGATVAADSFGNVTVGWHAGEPESTKQGEANRRVFIAQSIDDGKSFGAEVHAADEKLGACACCGMCAAADTCGRVLLMYRAAKDGTARSAVLLRGGCSEKGPEGLAFKTSVLQEWAAQTCPMSSFSAVIERGGSAVLAWETKGQVWFARCRSSDGEMSPPVSAPGAGGSRKHPRVAVNASGQTLLVWAEGTGWQKGGTLAWQVFDSADKPIPGATGKAESLPVWGAPAAVALPDGKFEVLY